MSEGRSRPQHDNSLLIAAGEALYGENWQAPLARALNVHRDTVQDWRQGRSKPRPSIYGDLSRLVEARLPALTEALALLRARA